LVKKSIPEDGLQNHHRKNHSMVINRAEVMRVESKRLVENSPDRFGGQSNKALKLPGMQDQQQYVGLSHTNSNYGSQIGEHQPPSDYLKSLNQTTSNANTRAIKTKGSSARSVERL